MKEGYLIINEEEINAPGFKQELNRKLREKGIAVLSMGPTKEGSKTWTVAIEGEPLDDVKEEKIKKYTLKKLGIE